MKMSEGEVGPVGTICPQGVPGDPVSIPLRDRLTEIGNVLKLVEKYTPRIEGASIEVQVKIDDETVGWLTPSENGWDLL